MGRGAPVQGGAARRDFAGPVIVPDGQIYVLGDNSGDSLDSRYYGPVRLERFVGKPVAITRPWSRVRWLARDAGDGSSR